MKLCTHMSEKYNFPRTPSRNGWEGETGTTFFLGRDMEGELGDVFFFRVTLELGILSNSDTKGVSSSPLCGGEVEEWGPDLWRE